MSKLSRFSFIAAIFGLSLAFFTPVNAALNGNDFKAGDIISDYEFTNKDSMSVTQIQDFLWDMLDDSDQIPDGVNGFCDTDGSEPYGGTTKAIYGTNHGNPPPFTCLPSYHENPANGANNYGGGAIPPGAISSAQIIKNAAMAYNINPQVLIVMLQKEQGLVTDDWAWEVQYEFAMGYGCFDNGGGCGQNSSYPGFYQQVDSAAWQLRQYIDHPENYNFDVGLNYILWNVASTGCGGSNVNILNSATAALYNYTPYQPNQAALNNLYGTGNGCSAYGNRNFWRYFNEWFGDKYLLASMDTPSGTMMPGTSKLSEIRVKNISGKTWYSDGNVPAGETPTRLATNGFISSPYAYPDSSGWINQNQIRLKEVSVAPGQIGTFEFTMKAPWAKQASYKTAFKVYTVGEGLLKGSGLSITLNTPAPRLSFSLSSISAPSQLIGGDTWLIKVKLLNNGTVNWYGENSPYPSARLFTRGYKASPYYNPGDPNWLAAHSIKLKQAVVKPGENGVFEFIAAAPYEKEAFTHNFGLTITGTKELFDEPITWSIATPAPSFNYQVISAIPVPASMTTGQQSEASLILLNNGNTTWRNEASALNGQGRVRLIMNNPLYRVSDFYDSSDGRWINGIYIVMEENQVRPGQTATFKAFWKAPISLGSYIEAFRPAMIGEAVFINKNMQFTTTVTP